MAIDRAAILRTAEKLLRQGKLESAIAEYLRVVESQPDDWTTANTLGDLYVRAGQNERAVEQFTRIAGRLTHDGFLPKAAAVYKKILKVRPDDEHALLQAGEIAASQGVLVDARAYFNAIAERRMARGDRRGAAEMRVRLGSLDSSDFDARRLAAHARIEEGDQNGALQDFKAIAADLTQKGRLTEAVRVLEEAAGLFSDDMDIRRQLFGAHMSAGDLQRAREYATDSCDFPALARAFMAKGDAESAAAFLSVETAASDPQLLMQIAELKLRGGAVDEGLGILRQLLNQDPTHARKVTVLGWELGRTAPDLGFRVVNVAADTAVLEADWLSAAGVLQEFAARVPNHLPALRRLVELCVDGRLDAAILSGAQAQLVDGYLSAGALTEARVLAEDLVAREPWERSNIERLRRLLALCRVDNPDSLIADRLSAPSPFSTAEPSFDEDERALAGVGAAPSVEETPLGRAAGPRVGGDSGDTERDRFELTTTAGDLEGILGDVDQWCATVEPEPSEVDLTVLLDASKGAVVPPLELGRAESALVTGSDIEAVFEQFRERAPLRSTYAEAEQEYERGIALRDAGKIDESIQALQGASRGPLLRFRAAAALGRIYSDRGAPQEAIEWFERAAAAPPPTAADAHALFYELAATLESTGEAARALAVCLELQAEAGDYRDVSVRINRLFKAQARG